MAALPDWFSPLRPLFSGLGAVFFFDSSFFFSLMHIVILGASSGIGLEVARRFLAQGHRVGLAARRTETLLALQAQHPSQVEVACIDVNAPDASQQLLSLIDRLGGMDLYFHSSGVGFTNPELVPDKELDIATTNCQGFTRLIGQAYRHFVAQGRGGHIAAITSVAGTKGLGAAPAYSASKRYQWAYLQALAQLSHSSHHGIHITDLRPGFVATAFIASHHYPATLQPQQVARHMVRAIERRQRVATIDWRYHCLVWLWQLLPAWLWERLPLVAQPFER